MLKRRSIGVLMTEVEKDTLRRLAAEEGGLTQSAMVRRLIRQAAKRCGLWPPRAKREEVDNAN